MGADLKVYLPPQVQVADVAKVIGLSAGLPLEREVFSNGGGWYARVLDIKVVASSHTPEMCTINWTDLDGEHRNAYWHWETEHPQGYRLLSGRSTEFWVAVGRRLVDFFGGEMDAHDGDDEKVNYQLPARPFTQLHPTEDDTYAEFQERMVAIKPLTRAELEAARPLAAYDYQWKVIDILEGGTVPVEKQDTGDRYYLHYIKKGELPSIKGPYNCRHALVMALRNEVMTYPDYSEEDITYFSVLEKGGDMYEGIFQWRDYYEDKS